jgi:resuscitation-promoting factor RpfB
VLGLILIAGAVASGSDRDPTEATPRAPASSPHLQSTSPSTTPTPKLAKVPAVKGLRLTKAKRKLRAAGLEVGDIDRRPSSKRKNTVLKQGVDKGTKLKPGSSVDLVVAAPLPQVPSVIGRQESSAIRKLKKAGFKIKKTTQTKTTGRDGVILSQTPSGGRRAKPRSVVRIVISNVQRRSDADATRNCTPGYSPCLPPASDYDCAGNDGNGPEWVDGPVRVMAVVLVAPVWSCMSDGPPPMIMTRWSCAGGRSTLAAWFRLLASTRTPATSMAVFVVRSQILGRTPLLAPYCPPL